MHIGKLFLWGALVTGCAHTRSQGPGELELALRSGDHETDQRAEEGALSRAIDHYLHALSLDPRSAHAMEGLARAMALYAYGGGGGIADYRVAREKGFECLLLNPGFQATVGNSGGVLDREALGRVREREWSCLYWATWAWSRWVHARSAQAMSMDHQILQLMSQRVLELCPEESRGDALALQGMVLALSIESHPSARRAFHEGIELRPSELTPRVDLAEWVMVPAGEFQEAIPLLETVLTGPAGGSDPARTLENQKAAARAARLLLDLEVKE